VVAVGFNNDGELTLKQWLVLGEMQEQVLLCSLFEHWFGSFLASLAGIQDWSGSFRRSDGCHWYHSLLCLFRGALVAAPAGSYLVPQL